MLARPDLPERHPQNVPLSQWTDGWLKMSCADNPLYIIMTDDEKKQAGLPVTRQEMIDHLVAKQNVPAAGL